MNPTLESQLAFIRSFIKFKVTRFGKRNCCFLFDLYRLQEPHAGGNSSHLTGSGGGTDSSTSVPAQQPSAERLDAVNGNGSCEEKSDEGLSGREERETVEREREERGGEEEGEIVEEAEGSRAAAEESDAVTRSNKAMALKELGSAGHSSSAPVAPQAAGEISLHSSSGITKDAELASRVGAAAGAEAADGATGVMAAAAQVVVTEEVAFNGWRMSEADRYVLTWQQLRQNLYPLPVAGCGVLARSEAGEAVMPEGISEGGGQSAGVAAARQDAAVKAHLEQGMAVLGECEERSPAAQEDPGASAVREADVAGTNGKDEGQWETVSRRGRGGGGGGRGIHSCSHCVAGGGFSPRCVAGVRVPTGKP